MVQYLTLEGNEAVAKIAYKLTEVFPIYPITPSTSLGELADEWSARGQRNIFGTVPLVAQMQSEAGAVGALHGAVQTGSLATTFTASQGLLLMIPNMYKLAGELTPTVFHIPARSIAAQALSIFGDHQDVMAVRQTGFALLCSASVQEAHDLALIAHLSTLKSRIPFVHFYDGFRTSHEINKTNMISDEVIEKLVDHNAILEHRKRAMSPESPFIRGTAQNADVYFQGRESANSYYNETPAIVQNYMDEFAKLTGRQYKIYEYTGAPDADRVVVVMATAGNTLKDVSAYLNSTGEKVGVLQVRLYRPFDIKMFLAELPKSVKRIAVLDKTKEPGSLGEPLYLDVSSALFEGNRRDIDIIGGRYGLSSKEFTPSMAKAVFDELKKDQMKNHFTIGINDDVTHLSLDYDRDFLLEPDCNSAIFFGLGSDGTVGANKNSIKIICDEDEYYGQGFFLYDSKKAGSITASHLRFGKTPINSSYLIQSADFVAAHQFSFVSKIDVLENIKRGGIFLINSHFDEKEVWHKLPQDVQKKIIEYDLKLYNINAHEVALKSGMGSRINTIMQTCFFKLSKVMDSDKAIAKIKEAIVKTYSRKGEEIVKKNIAAVDMALEHLYEVDYRGQVLSAIERYQHIPDNAPEFIKNYTAKVLEGKGDELPVSLMSVDGTFPSGSANYDKAGVSDDIATWHPENCTQCGLCVFACPHTAIKVKIYDEKELEGAPKNFNYLKYRDRKLDVDRYYTLQISPQDCTGCDICVKTCPTSALSMQYKIPTLKEREESFSFFTRIKNDFSINSINTIKSLQSREPMFEYSSACAGCGETVYLKLITQMFGDRMLTANATGCSSIYGASTPTTPWSFNSDGRGPAWNNSLFEDNAEFGFGYKLTQEHQKQYALKLIHDLKGDIGESLVEKIMSVDAIDDETIAIQRENVEEVKKKLENSQDHRALELMVNIDAIINRSVWIVGGDGWAYDIGFGGLDHVMASGRNINILILDTEGYANTGGQASKSTPLGASAKFAVDGKKTSKKDFGAMARSYQNVYVAQIAARSSMTQTLKALKEAESYNGVSIVIAFSSCIAQGVDLTNSIQQQKNMVDSGFWLLYRYDPRLRAEGKNPMQLDSSEPSLELEEYLKLENRFMRLKRENPEAFAESVVEMKSLISERWERYKKEAGK